MGFTAFTKAQFASAEDTKSKGLNSLTPSQQNYRLKRYRQQRYPRL